MDRINRWTTSLNEEQQMAATHTYGPMLCLAGAGSGKTTVLISRTGLLIENGIAPASRICVLTFTNKAARELQHRVNLKLGAKGKGLFAGTFHSFALHFIRRLTKQKMVEGELGILDPSDARTLVKDLLKDFKHHDKEAFDSEQLHQLMGEWRERGQRSALKEDPYEEACEFLLPRYESRLQALGVIDFDGLLLRSVELLQDPKMREQMPFDQIMVDEFQDTNKLQMRLCTLLSSPHQNLVVVGDDDQSIYGWRGACIRNILDFPKSYSDCKVVKLVRNYRSTQKILDLANWVISKNSDRHGKNLVAALPSESLHPEWVTYTDESEEIEATVYEIKNRLQNGIPHKEIAVLYRSNSMGALIEAELRKNQIPYAITGGMAFFDRKEIRDLLAYLRSALSPNELALRRVINLPSRGIGDRTIEQLATEGKQSERSFVSMVKSSPNENIVKFINSLSTLSQELISKHELSVGGILLDWLNRIGYRRHLEQESKNPNAIQYKWRVLEIFSQVVDRWVEKKGRSLATLREFLTSMELRELPEEQSEQRVQLMTLHACKGLEFEVVFLVGVEEDLIPHRTLGSDISEERRLFYVGITRAKKELVLSYARRRNRFGRPSDSVPSRFMMDIPKEMLSKREGPKPISAQERRKMLDELYQKLGTTPGTP